MRYSMPSRSMRILQEAAALKVLADLIITIDWEVSRKLEKRLRELEVIPNLSTASMN